MPVRSSVVVVMVASSMAWAHHKQLAPPEWQVTNALGDPQKTEPCGTSTPTPTNAVTTVTAGQTLKVKWQETIGHPGHYRLRIVKSRSELTTPTAVVSANNCVSAPIEPSSLSPFVADGLFPHDVGMGGTTFEQDVIVPNLACDDCTLQVLQFMSSHAPPCFYYSCATLKIVPVDGGMPETDGGLGESAVHQGAGCGCDASGGLGMLAALAVVLAARSSRGGRARRDDAR